MRPRQGRTFRAFGIAVALTSALLVGHRPPTAAGPLQARPGQRRAGDVLLSTHEPADDYVDAAYNTDDDEYLVVWHAGRRILGQRLDHMGTPRGDVLQIGAPTTDRKYKPAAAWSPRARAWLVVWEEVHHDYDIEGQLVGADGRLLDNPHTPEDESSLGETFAVCDAPGDQQRPRVDFDGSAFLVVWHDTAPDDQQGIAGRFVQDDGEVLRSILELADCRQDGCNDPAVAYGTAGNDYLVAWQGGDDREGAVHAIRVHPSGTPVGDAVELAPGPGCRKPDVAALPDGAFLVVFDSDPTGSNYDVLARRMLADGSVVPIDIAVADGEQFMARVANAPGSDLALVTWADSRAASGDGLELHGQRLQGGDLLGPPLNIAGGPRDDFGPAVAAASDPEAFLVVWAGGPPSETDIFGQIVATTGALVGSEIGVSAALGAQAAPALAYDPDDEQYLAIWADGVDGRIVARRLDGAGIPVEAPWPVDAEGSNADPAVLYHAGRKHYLAVWTDSAGEWLEGAVLFPGGGAIQPFQVALGRAAHPAMIRGAGDEDRVLVVYQQEGDIRSAALYGDGSPTRQGLRVMAEGSSVQGHPALAADSDGSVLVAWEASRAGGTNEIRGRVTALTGAPEGDELCLAGCQDAFDHTAPALAHDPTRDEYLLLHARAESPEVTRMSGQRLTTDGTAIGAGFDLDAEPSERHAPLRNEAALAFDAALGSHMAAWPAWGPDGARMDLYFRLLAPPPGTSTPARLIVHMAEDQTAPAAAVASAAGEYLLAWTDGRRLGASDVCARPVAFDVTPPEARLSVQPSVATVGATLTLDAQASTDDRTPRSMLRARWDWTGDGTWDTGWSTSRLMTRTVQAAGLFTPTVQIADLAENVAVDRQPVRVCEAGTNLPPVARVSAAPTSGRAGDSFEFDAGASSDRETPAGELQLRWDWGDDGRWESDWGREVVVSRRLLEAGPYRVRLEVRDGDGLTDAASALVMVEPGEVTRLVVEPRRAVVGPRQGTRFRAAGTDAHGNELAHPAVEWLLLDSSVGRIDARGWFTSSLRAGAFEDVVRARSGPVEAAASVTVLWPCSVFLPLAEVRR